MVKLCKQDGKHLIPKNISLIVNLVEDEDLNIFKRTARLLGTKTLHLLA